MIFFKKKPIKEPYQIVAKILIAIFLAIGLFIYKDYGISWDEMFQRSGGIANLVFIYEYFDLYKILSYFFENVPVPPDNLMSLSDLKNEKHLQRFYGVVFDLPVTLMEYFFFGISDDGQKIYQFRHLITFLIFVFGIWSLYLQAEKLFSSHMAGVLAMLLMMLSPRMFAEGFYNSKDIVFMCLISLGMLTLTNLTQNLTFKNILFHSLITALAINTRLMGVLFLPLTIFVLFACAYAQKNDISNTVKFYLIYLLISIILTFIFFPYLWEAPIQSFVEAFQSMSKFPAESNTLYMGNLINVTELPWHYIPVWMAATIPPFITILFTIGIGALSINLIKKPQNIFNIRNILLISNLGIILASIATIILLNAVIYNGWRHMYFVYPAFIMISTYGFMFIFQKIKIWRYGTIVLTIVFSTFIGHQLNWLVKAHPVQNVYFNFIVGSDWKKKFDMDYWGVGNHIMIKNILLNDKSESISICAKSITPLINTLRIMNLNDKKRIKLDCEDYPDYLLTNYIGVKQSKKLNLSGYKLFHQKKIFKEIIISTYKKI